jgi:hypothetical protein
VQVPLRQREKQDSQDRHRLRKEPAAQEVGNEQGEGAVEGLEQAAKEVGERGKARRVPDREILPAGRPVEPLDDSEKRRLRQVGEPLVEPVRRAQAPTEHPGDVRQVDLLVPETAGIEIGRGEPEAEEEARGEDQEQPGADPASFRGHVVICLQ